MSTPRTLADWLSFQERLHPQGIVLGLERVREVLTRLMPDGPAFPVLVVAGTNGKGSCVAMLEAALAHAGTRVGAYTSPHLVHYNERVRIASSDADDAALCAAFTEVEAARAGVPLTYFEYGTCAALAAFRAAGVGAAVLEVGLGGRLDAVNAVDALGAVVTTIGLDHQDLLGPDRESIGREKAGVFRAGRPAVCGDAAPPRSLREVAEARGTPLWVRGRDFEVSRSGARWTLTSAAGTWRDLPPPALAGDFQIDNAAAACALLQRVGPGLGVGEDAARAGLLSLRHPGRLELVAGPIPHLLDVAHNPQAAAVLARHLVATRGAGRTLLVLGVLADKDAEGIASELAGAVDEVHAAGLSGPRGQSGAALAARIAHLVSAHAHADVHGAHAAALARAQPGDRIVVSGSFHTVGEVRARGVYSPADD